MHSIRLLPYHRQEVLVRLEGNPLQPPLLVECAEALQHVAELNAEDALVSPTADGLAQIVLSNSSGFTQTVDSGSVIGEASSVSEKLPPDAYGKLAAVPTADIGVECRCHNQNSDPDTEDATVLWVEGPASHNHSQPETIRCLFEDTGAPRGVQRANATAPYAL